MKALALGIALSVLCSVGVVKAEDNFRPLRSSNRCTTHHCNVAQAVVAVQQVAAYVPTYVQLVPAQVVVNGQVTSYNTGFSYSYTPAPQAVQQVGPQQVTAQASPCSQLEERVKQLEALLKTGASTSSVPPPPTPEAPVAALESPDAFVKGYLTQNCAKCHTPGHKGAEYLTLANMDGSLLEKLPRAAIYKAIMKQPHEPGFMPKGGAPVSDEIKQKILSWVEEGLDGLNY
jgi:mono/diheme cytochrome c family protein